MGGIDSLYLPASDISICVSFSSFNFLIKFIVLSAALPIKRQVAKRILYSLAFLGSAQVGPLVSFFSQHLTKLMKREMAK